MPVVVGDRVRQGEERAIEQRGRITDKKRVGHHGASGYGARAMRTITGLDELKAAEGETLGTSEWHEVTQEDIDAFADVTGDHQWIHVDPERAKDTPFGGTIAHGYYTLSLAPRFTEQVLALDGFAFAINYGLNKVRFPAPLPVGGRVRMTRQARQARGRARAARR